MDRVESSVNLCEADVAGLDAYVLAAGVPSRSAAIAEAIRLLGDPELQGAYEAAWQEWAASGDEEAWESTAKPEPSTMTTLHIRDVPEKVAATLQERAAAEGTSLPAYVAMELAKLAARPNNEEIVARLTSRDRSSGPTSEEIVAAAQSDRRR